MNTLPRMHPSPLTTRTTHEQTKQSQIRSDHQYQNKTISESDLDQDSDSEQNRNENENDNDNRRRRRRTMVINLVKQTVNAVRSFALDVMRCDWTLPYPDPDIENRLK